MSLFSELRRRNVFRVGIAYLIGGWLIVQVADIVLENIGAPAWVMQVILLLLVLGFIGAVFFSWAFEVTPEGLKLESEVDRSQSITGMTGRKLDRSITVMLVIALGYFIWESRFAERGAEPPVVVEEAVSAEASEATEETSATDKSIAVLPFDNRSSRDEDEYFTEGIHDDLLTNISKIGSMRVISRTSVMEYKDTTKNLRDIAKELGVANILEGGVQRSGNQVRINVQLIDAATDDHLWAEIYDRELTAENLFTIQSEISIAIAEALHATLSPEDQEKVEVVHTQNLEAYESYLQGRKLWTERTAESNVESVKHFQHAIDLDPAFALAYVGLSDAYRFRTYLEGALPDDVYPLAERAARTALQLNPNLGEAYASLGSLKREARDFDGAIADYQRAIELSPSHLDAYNWYAITLATIGRQEEAIDLVYEGLKIDPLSPTLRNNLAFWLMRMGRFEDAQATIKRSIELHPDGRMAYLANGFYQYSVEGRIDEALKSWSQSMRNDPDDVQSMVIVGGRYLELGDRETAERWLDKALLSQPDNIIQNVERLNLALLNDDNASAIQSAQNLYEQSLKSNQWTGNALEVLRDADIAAGNPANALQRYAALYPEIVENDAPEVHTTNYEAAAQIAYLQLQMGNTERGKQTLQAAIPVIKSVPLMGLGGSCWGNAYTYTLLGRKEEALAELQRGVAAGCNYNWHYTFNIDPIFAPLRDQPEFVAMRETVQANLTEQLARVRELEASGEILRP